MECREVREYLPAYAEQAGGPRASAVDEHLRTCAGCRLELEQFRELARALGALTGEQIEPPAWLLGTLTETVGEGAKRLAVIRQRRSNLASTQKFAAGGVLLAGVAGALLMRGLWRKRRRFLQEQVSEA